MTTLAILGAGGTSLFMRDVAARTGLFTDYIFLDDDPTKHSRTLDETPIAGTLDSWSRWGDDTLFISSLYAPRAGRRLMSRVGGLGIPAQRWAKVVDPTAMVSPTVHIGCGAFIGPQVTIEPNVSLRDHAYVAANSIISHDTEIGRHVYCASASAVGSRVRCEDAAFLGIGCRIMNRLNVGTASTVGMGAVVTRSVPPWCTVAGTPARILTYSDPLLDSPEERDR